MTATEKYIVEKEIIPMLIQSNDFIQNVRDNIDKLETISLNIPQATNCLAIDLLEKLATGEL